MKNLAEKISDAELEVMRVLWETGDALSVTDIRTTLQQRKGWEATTVKTLISRLASKGALIQEKRNVYYYRPAISREAYNDWAAKDLVNRLFQGNARNLVATLFKSDGLTPDDIRELSEEFHVEE